jgi:antitoxin (DNA-binding transcriptional repressor) of toxin-antitoxin stability system
MHITNISEAKASLSQLIKTVQATNKPIIIGKAGKPVALLSAFIEDETPRTLTGNWKGKVSVSEDFDEMDDDLISSFYNSSVFPK